jgi:hypothetical protein
MEVNNALVSREAVSGKLNFVGKYKDFQYYMGQNRLIFS